MGAFSEKVRVLTELSASAPSERAKRYRELERAARQEAEQFVGSMLEGYLSIASGWQRLAEEAEAAAVVRAEDAVLNDNDREQKEPRYERRQSRIRAKTLPVVSESIQVRTAKTRQ